MNDCIQVNWNNRYYRLVIDDFGRMKYTRLNPVWHYHAVYHLILISEGRCAIEFEDGNPISLEANDLVFINPLVRHRFRVFERQAVEHTAMLWRFVDAGKRSGMFYLQELYGVARPEAEPFVILKLSEMERRNLGDIHRRVLNLLRRERHDPALLPHFFYVWLSFFSLIAQRGYAVAEADFSQLAERIVKTLHAAVPDSAFNNETLGEKLGHHHNYLNRIFRRKTGYSLREFLTMLRMRRSCELLLRSDFAIGEIAGRCGFSDPGYFSRVFRRYCQVSPGEFRRRGLDMPGCFRTEDSLFVLPEDWKTANAVVKNEPFPR